MMIKTITAVPVERDERGLWTHPDDFEPVGRQKLDAEGEFEAWKGLNRVVGKLTRMSDEDNSYELEKAYEANCDCSIWQPTPPVGDGWFIASIHETGEGPVCYWLRPIECDPDTLAAHREQCHIEALKLNF